jgi:twinkle protein
MDISSRALSVKMAEKLEAHRGIPCEIAARYNVVSNGVNLGFEFYQDGAHLYTKWVAPRSSRDEKKKIWRAPADTASVMWNLSSLQDAPAASTLVITEGEIDALSVLTSGAEPYVVSVPDGARSKSVPEGVVRAADDNDFGWLYADDRKSFAPELKPFSRFVLCVDNDAAGWILRDNLAKRLGPKRCWFVTYPDGCKDANDVLLKFKERGVVDLIRSAQPLITSRLVSIDAIEPRDRVAYGFGVKKLDTHIQIYQPELVIVSGKPNAGKSQFMLWAGLQLARVHGLKGAIIQAEDDDNRIKEDVLRYAKSWKLGDRWANEMIKLTRAPKGDEDEEDRDLKWLAGVIDEAVTRHGCAWVVLDPWNELAHNWSRNESETNYLNEALRHMRSLARRYNITIFIVAHPTKGIADKPIEDVTLYDVAGSAAWANKADHGVIMARLDGSTDVMVNVVKVRDQRLGGTQGMVTMRFNRETASYTAVD